MPRRRDESNRVLGPTWIPSQWFWRIVVITPGAPDPKDRRTTQFYREEDEAREVAEAIRRQLAKFDATNIGEAIDGYAQHLQDKGTRGAKETIRRLRLFFPDHGMLVNRLSQKQADRLYADFRKRLRPDGKPISVAYHRAALINARSMMSWSIKQGWISVNPFAEVEGIGVRKRGKKKPTGDEARKLFAYCMHKAESGDATALGVLMALLMALRSSDLTRRLVRDVDLDATQLIVEDAKTDASNEPRHVPEILQPMLRRLVAGRPSGEPLFKTPYTKSGHHTNKWLWEGLDRFCDAADIPRICPHALKGTAGSLLARKGAAADLIADHLSHVDSSTTFKHYVDKRLVEVAQAGAALRVFTGGKR